MKYLIITIFVWFNLNVSKNTEYVKIYDYEMFNDYLKVRMVKAFIMTESSWDEKVVNKKEDAVGLFQTRPIMLKQINKMVGYDKYSLKDRFEGFKSIELFLDAIKYKKLNFDLVLTANFWNCGHVWKTNPQYIKKILANLK